MFHLYVITILFLALIIGSFIYGFYHNKSKYLIGLVYGFASIWLLIIGMRIWYTFIAVIIVGCLLVYFHRDFEVAKGTFIGAIIAILSLVLFIVFNLGMMGG